MTWWWLVIVAVRAALPIDATPGCGSELAALDRVRAEAFAAADPALLAQVYEPRSPLLAIDAATIAAYRDRGGRVVGAQLQISDCQEAERTADMIRFEVVDALGTAVVVWDDGGATALPRDRPTGRTVTVLQTADGWRISESRPRGPTSDQGPRK